MSAAPQAPAATFVIFGATGDLTRRLLLPALVNLVAGELLHPDTSIIGIGRSEGDDEALRERLSEFVEKGPAWDHLRERTHCLQGDFTDAALFEQLKAHVTGNTVFYLATAPDFFGPIVEKLAAAGLLEEADGFRRVVIEKPFGTDLASAQALDRELLEQADETQIYRIDHFLGKETVQNIMVLRFGNPMVEAVWNSRYIDHVQITAAEAVTVGSRGSFYDATGALRDMVPNHLFQLLSLVAMEPPNSFDAEAVRTEKAKVIAAVPPVHPEDAVRGQYGAGSVKGEAVAPYREADDVDRASDTETYVAMKVLVETWRWHGVPFYLRTGKALATRDTEIVVRFREAPIALFRETDTSELPPNELVLQLQPDEGLELGLAVKRPGPLVETAPATLHFGYADAFDLGHRTGYETLLYDVLTGDQTLFQRADQIEGGWRAVQPLLDAWKDGAPEGYAAGSDGPDGAAALLARDGRAWHAIR